MPETSSVFTKVPTQPADRNFELDVLRGFALLGILLINIQSFSMVEAAGMNPAAFGDFTGLNRWAWLLSHVFASSKFMTLFSIMFGASVLLFTDRLEARGQRPVKRYYLRIFWLITFGMLHAYLLWHGDILVTYGFCGLTLYLFRKRQPRTLVILGLSLVAVPSLLYNLFQGSIPYWGEADLTEIMASWSPTQEQIAEKVAAYRGGWLEQMRLRVPKVIEYQTLVILIYTGWRVGGLMLLGMAFYRWGVLTGQRSTRIYLGCILVGFLTGFPLVVLGVIRNFAADWSFKYSMFAGSLYNYWGSLPICLGYIGVIMLACRKYRAAPPLQLLAQVGRSALSNYILQTVLCTFIFYGYGLALFGKVSRIGQLGIVIAVWSLQILLTHLWLKRFQYGPLEWLWRTLIYLKRPPMRLSNQDKMI